MHRDVTPIEQLRKEYRAKQPAPKRVLTNEEVGRTKAWKKYNQMMEDTANHGDVLYTEDGKMMILEKGFGPGVQKVVMYPGF